MISSSDEEELLLMLALSCKRKRRRWLMHEINEKRERLGEYHRLCVELQSHEDLFFKYFRMSRVCFEEIHSVLRPSIVKYTTNWRRPTETRERLAICLRLVHSAYFVIQAFKQYTKIICTFFETLICTLFRLYKLVCISICIRDRTL